MREFFLKVHVKLFTLLYGEEGQDLVEVALLVSMIALVATIGMHKEATAIRKVFSDVKTDFKSF